MAFGPKPAFLNKTGSAEFNSQLKRTQFADSHGHGWLFRQVFKRDREGNLLDAKDAIVSPDDANRFNKAVHLNDIHLEKGMHCVDCHFRQDAHGNGILYNEPRAAIEIGCIDCHGTIREPASLVSSGFAAGAAIRDGKIDDGKGRNLATIRFRDSDGGSRVAVSKDHQRPDEERRARETMSR